MKRGERGFTLIELLVVIATVALIAAAATMSTFQVFNVTRHSNDHMATVRQVQNAGYWISRDALMAESVVVDNDPETDEFQTLTLKWAEWDFDKKKSPVVRYHEVTYSSQDLSDEVGKLERNYVIYDDEGEEIESETNLVAEYIDYDFGKTYARYESPDEPLEQAPVLTVQITASLGEASETREYRVLPRPDY